MTKLKLACATALLFGSFGRDGFRHPRSPTACRRHLQRRSGPLGLQPLRPVLVAAELLRLLRLRRPAVLRRLGPASLWLAPSLVTAFCAQLSGSGDGAAFFISVLP